MITFGPMPPLAVLRPSNRIVSLAALALSAAALLLATPAAYGQSALSHTEDATPVPAGSVRFTITNGWTRYDSRFGEHGVTRGLGDELSTDSLGPRQLPKLAPVEAALQTLASNPAQRLTLGKLDARSDARIVTTPFAIEYGITHRLSFGVVVPLVQTRRSVQLRVNEHTATDTARRGNTGLIPVTLRQNASSSNAAVVAALTTASSNLSALLTHCQANPAAPECNPIRGREAAAAAAAQRAAEFAAGVRTAYGVTEETAVVAPLAGSQLAAQIEAQRAALAAQLATFAPGVTVGTLFNAPTEFSYADFQGRNTVPGLLQSDFGGGLDSIRTTERIGIGDVELRAAFMLLDHMQPDSLAAHGLRFRVAVGASYRFGTSKADTARNLMDIGTGDGPGAEARTAIDVLSGRVGATVAARFSTSFARTVDAALVGYPEGGFPYPLFGPVTRKNGNVLGIDVSPRVFLSEWLAFEGEYGFEHTGLPTFTGNTSECSACAPLEGSILPAARTVQRAGVGLRYSTIDSYLRGRARYPIEVSYRHLETITGDAGAPKLFRDQIQLRIFYRILR
ncbi:MAG TPA: hypothetical protein VGP25_06985 [Gemmatimonadaceae bacterium]|nr:hypothetical protein [Gemmatimonadaceae bacterium]